MRQVLPRQLLGCFFFVMIVLLCMGRGCSAQTWAGNMAPVMGDGAIVTSHFGYREDPQTGEGKFHKGVDVSDGIEGTPVYAACDGIIGDAGFFDPNGYGAWIEIYTEDDQYGTIMVGYAHCRPTPEVLNGNWSLRVTKGQYIGNAITIGKSTGSHAHIEVRQGNDQGNPLDPGIFFPSYAGGSGGAAMSGIEVAVTKLQFDVAYKFGEPLQEFSETISKACISGLDKLKDVMVYLFFILITIDLIYGVSMLMIDSEQGNSLFKWLLSKTLMYLILLYIISNWAGTVANFMRDFYVGAAATATGSSITDAQNAVANPFDLLQKGASIVAPIVQNIVNPAGIILSGVMFLAMVVLFGLCAIICFQILMAYIEFYMVMIFGFVLFVTSGSKHVRQFAARAFNAMFMVCAKLMFMVFFSMMVQNVMTNLQTDNLIKQHTITVAAGGEKEVFDTLKGMGASDGQIAGIMGNIKQEDGPFNPAEQNELGYTGLFQWDPVDRWPRFVEWCEKQSPPLNPYSNAVQVRYAVTEEYGNLLPEISSDPQQAAADWHRIFERSLEGPGDEGYDNRLKNALGYQMRIHDGILEGATNGMTTRMTVSVMDFALLCKIIVILLAFMFIADRISSSLIKGFANGGFKFGND